MPTLVIPRLASGRDLAAAAVAELGPVQGQEVTLDATGLVSGASSYCAQLVRSTLIDAAAQRLIVLGGPGSFCEYVRDAATALEVADRVEFCRPD